jgi:hypothetical protein
LHFNIKLGWVSLLTPHPKSMLAPSFCGVNNASGRHVIMKANTDTPHIKFNTSLIIIDTSLISLLTPHLYHHWHLTYIIIDTSLISSLTPHLYHHWNHLHKFLTHVYIIFDIIIGPSLRSSLDHSWNPTIIVNGTNLIRFDTLLSHFGVIV